MNVPEFAQLSTKNQIEINYLCNIRAEKDFNIRYLEEKKIVVLRNCNEIGNLIDLSKRSKGLRCDEPWVLLKVKIFYDQVLHVFLFFMY